jgi:phospholipase C
MPNKIEHLVVLMMENRSFDHMLGFLKSPGWPIDGLNGAETNPDSTGATVRVTPDALYAGDLVPDPGHDFISVNEQIYGNSTATGSPTMQGFVKAYMGKAKDVAKSHNVMKCFGPGRLPVLSTLAREYAVCDRWFASVPGPTLPNRAFAMGATSHGRVDMVPDYFINLKTVFELLDGHGVSSKIYFTDFTAGLAVLFLEKNRQKFFGHYDDFKKDCKNNRLPAYSFIEPRYYRSSSSGDEFPPTDQHPDHNVFRGEQVITAVYDALTSNQQTWESSLLVITYDEHGGLYDHVPPPACVSPGDQPVDTLPFSFERLGVRVPAVLVSPFIPRGTIIRDVFDHTSIIATASKLFITSPPTFLTQRDRNANTFEGCLTLAAPRQGKVSIPKNPTPVPTFAAMTFAAPSTTTPAGALMAAARRGGAKAPRAKNASAAAKRALKAELEAGAASDAPLSDFQAAMISTAFRIERRLPATERTDVLVSSISTESEAADYLSAIHERVAARMNGGPAGAKRRRGKSASNAASKSAGKAAGKSGYKRARKASAKKR